MTRLDTLINRIQSDYVKRSLSKIDEPFPNNIFHTNDLSDEFIENDFFHSQLFIDCILHMKTTSTDITEFVNFCLNEYYGEQYQTSIIQDFKQKYKSEKSIWWYTQDSFVYRILSKAISMKNHSLLFTFGFLIRDIYENLQKFRLKMPVEVYYGRIMTIDEVNQLKSSLGQYLSVNIFISTDYDRRLIVTLLNDFALPNDCVRVLFEIHADPNLNQSKPVANITSLTCNPQSQQVLFTLGSVFQLNDIQQDKKTGIWIIKMTLSNIKKSYDENNLITCGYLLQKMRKNDEAEHLFLRLIKHISANNELSKCYAALGYLTSLKNNYESSLEWYDKFLKICNQNDPNLASIYYSIGYVYQNVDDRNQALQFYDKALSMWTELYGDEGIVEIAECLNNIGCIYEREQYYAKALECHKRSLSIRDKFQVDIGSCYNNIGNIYYCLGEYNSALENYNFAFQEKIKSRSEKDLSLATTLTNMGLVFEADTNYKEALNYYKKAALVYNELYSPTHVSNIEIQENIQRVSVLMRT